MNKGRLGGVTWKNRTYPLRQQKSRQNRVDADLWPNTNSQTLDQLKLRGLGHGIRHAGAALTSRLDRPSQHTPYQPTVFWGEGRTHSYRPCSNHMPAIRIRIKRRLRLRKQRFGYFDVSSPALK
jgi:hypothetical protein